MSHKVAITITQPNGSLLNSVSPLQKVFGNHSELQTIEYQQEVAVFIPIEMESLTVSTILLYLSQLPDEILDNYLLTCLVSKAVRVTSLPSKTIVTANSACNFSSAPPIDLPAEYWLSDSGHILDGFVPVQSLRGELDRLAVKDAILYSANLVSESEALLLISEDDYSLSLSLESDSPWNLFHQEELEDFDSLLSAPNV